MFIEDPQTATPEEPTDPATAALAAMDEGITAAADTPDPEPTVVVEPAPEADAVEPAAPVEPDANAPKPDAEPAAEEPKPDPIEDEVTSLNLKEKAAERFRELAADREEMAPLREAMKEVGLEDPKQAAAALARVRDADFVISRVVDTGASHEQFDKSLEYLALVNRGATGDLQALEQAWALIEPELQVIAKALGKEVPGIVDPLADHDDLRDEVEAGDLPRTRALEIARERGRSKMVEAQRAAARTTQEQQVAQQQAIEAGRQDLNALGAELQQADPARYAALGPVLRAKVAEISQQHPPHEWAARVARVYATLPTPQAAPAPAPRPPVGHVPMRPTGARPDLSPATFDDPMAALDFGIAQANR